MEAASRGIVLKILDHVIKNGGEFCGWQVGLTLDNEARLPADNLTPGQGYAGFSASSPDQARQIAEMLCNIYGFEGNPRESNGSASVVYCHKKTGSTDS